MVLGLVVGKLVGRHGLHLDRAPVCGIGVLPAGATWRGIVGVAALAGIGFTVSIFVTGLAFTDAGTAERGQGRHPRRVRSLAAGLGSLILVTVPKRHVRPRRIRRAPDRP